MTPLEKMLESIAQIEDLGVLKASYEKAMGHWKGDSAAVSAIQEAVVSRKEALEQASQLPDLCFVFVAEACPGEYVRAVRRGERGHFGTTYDETDPEKAEALVKLMNRKLGVTDVQAECMLAGSMFGWDSPGAKPELMATAIARAARAKVNTTTFVPINRETGEYCARGHEFDNHADAYIAALTDGAGALERDEDGYMRAVENGKQIYTGGSFNKDDQAAKDEVVSEIGRNLNTSDYRFTTLKVERDAGGNIVSIDDDGNVDLIEYWNSRIGLRGKPAAPKVPDKLSLENRLERAGFEEISTGGGFSAWWKECANGRRIAVTNSATDTARINEAEMVAIDVYQDECTDEKTLFSADVPVTELNAALGKVLREHSTLKAFEIGEKIDFKLGDPVIANGYRGTVSEVCGGQLAGMVVVRVPGGPVCISRSYPDCYPAFNNDVEVVTEGRHVGVVKERNAQFIAQDCGRGYVVVHEASRFEVRPKIGEVLDVQYRGGKAVTAEGKDQSRENGR